MKEELKKVGISVEPGMTAEALDRAEKIFGFRFPREIREFLSCCVPVGKDFFDYRDVSQENQKRFCDFQKRIEDDFRFDLENNREDMKELLAVPLGNPEDFDGAVLNFLHSSVKLIPFYAHRCFFDGMDAMPIVSFWQPVDSIFYGSNFRDYLETEFMKKELDVKDLPERRLKETGIWQYLVTP
jgi:hypothetical protein